MTTLAQSRKRAAAIADRIKRTRKRARKRLAKAEMVMFLALKTYEWARDLDDTPGTGTLPFDQWPEDDPFRDLSIKYGLSGVELAQILDRLGDELEYRAVRIGFDEHWEDDGL